MPLTFTHETLGQRVLFGAGLAAEHLAAEVQRLSARRVMVIAAQAERELAERITAGLPVALLHDDVAPHVPVEKAQQARTAAIGHGADLLVSVGGGSTTGLAKAVALTTGLPIIAVPTTYAGSEATNVWGLTEAAQKTTGVDARVLPAAVVYDADLVLTLPVELTVASGLNALAHCVDSLWAPGADPINQTMALEGARSLAVALRGIVTDPENLQAREQALYGCYLAAVAFASAGSGLHHKICHVLGGTFDLPHAQTHATVLPYVLAFNAPAVPELAGRLATALGHLQGSVGEDRHAAAAAMLNGLPVAEPQCPAAAAVSALNRLRRDLNAPTALAEAGFTEGGIPEAVKRVTAVAPASNPVAVTEENLTVLLTHALHGSVPTHPYHPVPAPTTH
ncbi:maleylacetate reductase [Kocuria dechangensis]|uniref:Maleylacetate reductase n=1 Tax=Kocuria dechangensis TaxID=1176249 RepID=A0A917GXZ8_9MICC|nr:maleylacetate reductase [Kocuria dechangensis]GGG59970.1 maleylacetate reductase [Kocuria dechangensis]